MKVEVLKYSHLTKYQTLHQTLSGGLSYDVDKQRQRRPQRSF